MLKKTFGAFCSFIMVFTASYSHAQEYVLTNTAYSVVYKVNSNELKLVNLLEPADTVVYKIAFNVMYKNAPYVTPVRVRISENVNYSVAAWSGNPDFYSVGTIESPVLENVSKVDDELLFEFAEDSKYTFGAKLTLPQNGTAYPILEYTLNSKSQTAYSIGFVGAPETEQAQLDELWQPMVWTEKKFPESSYLTLSFHCTLPAVMVTKSGLSFGVITDPEKYPFDPLPDYARSEFGVALRNQQSKAQPMIWAPVMGTSFSKLSAGDSTSFKIRLFCGRKSIVDFYKDLSDNLYGFKNYDRNNELGSLNNTIENMLTYGMSEYSRFDSVFKAPSYQTDIPGAVKNTTALSPLNISLLTDNKEIYKRRALPSIEFMLSRNNRTFSSNDLSGSSSSLGDPIMPVSEMVAVYDISGKKMPFLLDMAKENMLNLNDKANVKQWRDYIALYRATGEETYKTKAMSGADEYIADRIDNLETGFNYQHHSSSSFWVELAPKFVDLMELYDISGESRYLEAAYKAARRYAMYTFMSPAVPSGTITVNKGGVAPVYRSGVGPISIPEEDVPVWRMSEYGLHSEAAGTFTTHRAVFMAHHAPYFLRIGNLKNDEYLKRIAKSAVVGRYTNFPGYHINKDRTSVYEKPDFPLRSHEELTSTSMHYNHIWPMISLMYDYLITDIQEKSAGNIDFPYEFMEGEANIQDRLYGSKPGKFYDVDSAILWMPAKLLTIDNPQLNYISARKSDTLLIAFSNQSKNAVSAHVLIDTGLVKNLENKQLEYVRDGGSKTIATLSDNTFIVPVSANGITYVKVTDVQPVVAMQDSVFTSSDTSWTVDYKSSSFASAKAMLLSFGEGLSSIYIYSSEPVGTYTKMALKYTLNGADTITVTDETYPFEFTVPLSYNQEIFKYQLVTYDANGAVQTSQLMALSKNIIPKVNISGTSFIRQGESAPIKIDFEGTAPWSVRYSDGTQEYSLENITETPYILSVNPVQNTSYTIIEASDSNGSAEVSGVAAVNVSTGYLNPTFDGYVRFQGDKGFFTGNSMELKMPEAFAKEIFVTIDPALLPQNLTGKVAFRLYAYKADRVLDSKLRLEAIEQEFDSSLKWSTKPADSEFALAAEDVSYQQWQFPGYVSWDITDYINDFRASDGTKLSFRIKLVAGNDVLLTSYSSKNSSFKPELLFTDPTVLSVKYITFNLKQDLAGVRIEWEASVDNKNGYFEIEHSVDGKPFNVIGRVDVSGNYQKTQSYSFLDTNPVSGYNYYRIKYYENSLAEADSTEIKAIHTGVNNKAFSFKLFPNPSIDEVNFVVENPAALVFRVGITDMAGRNLYTQKYRWAENNQSFKISLSGLGLSDGIYLINFDDGINHKTLKLKVEGRH